MPAACPPPAFGHATPVLGAAFFPGGRRILTTCRDATARLWDGNGRPRATTIRGTRQRGPELPVLCGWASNPRGIHWRQDSFVAINGVLRGSPG
jgi:hypothetical protein